MAASQKQKPGISTKERQSLLAQSEQHEANAEILDIVRSTFNMAQKAQGHAYRKAAAKAGLGGNAERQLNMLLRATDSFEEYSECMYDNAEESVAGTGRRKALINAFAGFTLAFDAMAEVLLSDGWRQVSSYKSRASRIAENALAIVTEPEIQQLKDSNISGLLHPQFSRALDKFYERMEEVKTSGIVLKFESGEDDSDLGTEKA